MLGILYLVCHLYLEHTVLSPHKGNPAVLCSKPRVRLNACLIQEVWYGACTLFLRSCWELLTEETHPTLAVSSRRSLRLNSSQELHNHSLKPYLSVCPQSSPTWLWAFSLLQHIVAAAWPASPAVHSSVHLLFPGWHLHEGNKGVIRCWCQRVCLQGRVREWSQVPPMDEKANMNEYVTLSPASGWLPACQSYLIWLLLICSDCSHWTCW